MPDPRDPRDPLQITEGVYGVLVREYLPRNFTVWAWGLYGNEHLKGLELSPTHERTPEYGGRFQAPLSKGEIAFTTHYRRADLSKGFSSVDAGEDPLARENRYGLDGKWDVVRLRVTRSVGRPQGEKRVVRISWRLGGHTVHSATLSVRPARRS